MSPSPLRRSSGDENLSAAADVVIEGHSHARDEIEGVLVPGSIKHGEQAPQLLADVGAEVQQRQKVGMNVTSELMGKGEEKKGERERRGKGER